VEKKKLQDAASDGLAAGERTAIVAGRLVAFKGIPLALSAIARAPAWHLEIIGSGPEEARLKRLTNRLGITDRVRFFPWLSQRELWRRMASSSAVIVPSLRDAASYIAAEAVTLGVPVIALDQGGPRVLARRSPGSVHLVRATNPEEAAAGIASALADVRAAKPSPVFSIECISHDLAEAYSRARRHPARCFIQRTSNA
jgi:glycosyltransferase involved in cell wall biosynthesis